AVNEDPVIGGLVASLARPGGNLTGVNFFNAELAAKRLELLRQLAPATARVAGLLNPSNPAYETTQKELETAAREIGLQIQLFNPSRSREIDAAFETFVDKRPDALFVVGDALFTSRRVQLVTLAVRYAIPATFPTREYAEAGGLMSYGSNLADTYHQLGVY